MDFRTLGFVFILCSSFKVTILITHQPPLMEPQTAIIINLLDSLWYNHQIFKKNSNPNPNPNHTTQQNPQQIITMSDKQSKNNLGSRTGDSASAPAETEEAKSSSSSSSIIKTLSELEYEEVKGFIDLGFDFSDEEANSSLVEIVPGLQKLVKKTGECCCRGTDCCRARPYLSEAWEAMEIERMKKMKKALVKWKIPSVSNEIDMKDNLRWWAHYVASTLIR